MKQAFNKKLATNKTNDFQTYCYASLLFVLLKEAQIFFLNKLTLFIIIQTVIQPVVSLVRIGKVSFACNHNFHSIPTETANTAIDRQSKCSHLEEFFRINFHVSFTSSNLSYAFFDIDLKAHSESFPTIANSNICQYDIVHSIPTETANTAKDRESKAT